MKKKILLLKCQKILLKNGLKTLFEKKLRALFGVLKKRKKINPVKVLLVAIQKTKPFCEIKTLKIRGIMQRIPIQIKVSKQKVQVLKWLKINSKNSSEFGLVNKLAKEILDTLNLTSKTIKTCDELHKIAESNKMFAQLK